MTLFQGKSNFSLLMIRITKHKLHIFLYYHLGIEIKQYLSHGDLSANACFFAGGVIMGRHKSTDNFLGLIKCDLIKITLGSLNIFLQKTIKRCQW